MGDSKAWTHFARNRNANGGFRMRIRRIVLFAAVLSFLISASAFAHHGYASYDLTKAITLRGTVTEMQIINPHSRLLFDVKDSSGKVVKWSAEFSNPTAMRRDGWNRETLKAGDEITITGNVATNGINHMFPLRLIRMSDGKALRDRLGENVSTGCVDGIRWDAKGVGSKCE